jgi:hypothetical protein
MEIKASELRQGMEVDMPIERDKGRYERQRTIKYLKDEKRYALADIRTGEVSYKYDKLSHLLRLTNQIYDYKDTAIDD